MKPDPIIYLTQRERRNLITEKVLDDDAVLDFEREEAKNWKYIQHEVGKELLKYFRGRPIPLKFRGKIPLREAIKLGFSYGRPNFVSYPRKINTDKKRFEYLKKLLLENKIKDEIFIDLVSVLKIKHKKPKPIFRGLQK